MGERVDHVSDRIDLIGLSSEAKEIEGVDDGSTFYEVDTSTLYIFYKGAWYPQG